MASPALLFVCLGNICRSPLAEAAFRRAATVAGLDCRVDSAGTGDWHVGNPPDPRAIAEAARHGIDISRYRARQANAQDFVAFTHILALDTQNLVDLNRIAPTVSPGAISARVSLLLDHVPGRAGQSVADPYWGGPEDFAQTWADVEQAAAALVNALRRAG